MHGPESSTINTAGIPSSVTPTPPSPSPSHLGYLPPANLPSRFLQFPQTIPVVSLPPAWLFHVQSHNKHSSFLQQRPNEAAGCNGKHACCYVWRHRNVSVTPSVSGSVALFVHKNVEIAVQRPKDRIDVRWKPGETSVNLYSVNSCSYLRQCEVECRCAPLYALWYIAIQIRCRWRSLRIPHCHARSSR